MQKKSDYELVYSDRVTKFFKRLVKKDKTLAESLLKSIEEIKNDPFDSDLMQRNFKGAKKKRKGKYKIIFDIESDVVTLIKIDKRGKVYKR